MVRTMNSFSVMIRVRIRVYVKSRTFCSAAKPLKPKSRDNVWASELVRAL